MNRNSLKILCIGNSFSEDSSTYVAEMATSLGFSEVTVANLYIGGCPIAKHYDNIKNDLPAYRYGWNHGSGWTRIPDFKIRDAIEKESWDWICIQHGSSHGGFYTEDESYRDLADLVSRVKAIAGEQTKIAYNMTWVGEPSCNRVEMVRFHRDQVRYFGAICEITQRLVVPVCGIDLVCPTGMAIQNARSTALSSRLHRDGFHLSPDVGRYLAGVTFLCALSGVSPDEITWMPEGVTEEDRFLVWKAAKSALENPFHITEIKSF